MQRRYGDRRGLDRRFDHRSAATISAGEWTVNGVAFADRRVSDRREGDRRDGDRRVGPRREGPRRTGMRRVSVVRRLT